MTVHVPVQVCRNHRLNDAIFSNAMMVLQVDKTTVSQSRGATPPPHTHTHTHTHTPQTHIETCKHTSKQKEIEKNRLNQK